MFGLIGRSDKAGSGVDKILEGWKFAKWRRPYISEKSHPDVIELYLPLESLFSDTTLDGLKQIFGEQITDISHNELIILAMALSENVVSNSSLQDTIELHPSDLTKLLKKMCQAGLLISSGLGRGTTYRINRDYVASSDVASSDVASSGNTKDPDEENVTSMIMNYCTHTWLSAKEISVKIGRHPTHTRRIIKKMLACGTLIPEYPNQPTHPMQRYHTKQG